MRRACHTGLSTDRYILLWMLLSLIGEASRQQNYIYFVGCENKKHDNILHNIKHSLGGKLV